MDTDRTIEEALPGETAAFAAYRAAKERLGAELLAAALDEEIDLCVYLQPEGAARERSVPGSLIDEAVDRAVDAVQSLIIDSGAQLDAASLERLALGAERIRRCAETAAIAVTERIDATRSFQAEGFRNTRAYLRHRLQLSKSEAFRRQQAARMRPVLAGWAAAGDGGDVGVAQTTLMAQIAANTRLDRETLVNEAPQLLADAMNESYDRFEELARRWESLADPLGSAEQATQVIERRGAVMAGKDQGGWMLSAQFDEIGGSTFNEVFAWYSQAEWEADWAEAVARRGDEATTADMPRTELQRRADALVAMARAAAACPPDAKRPLPVLNVLFDAVTLEAVIKNEPIPSSRYRDVVCRTREGRILDLHEAANMVLWAEVRRVVLEQGSHVIDYGRSRRCFTGAAREAALLMYIRCIFPGCTVPVGRCQVDHARSWAKHHGLTNQENADPECEHHNFLKESGYTVQRDSDGHWHVFHPDGHEIR